jgi:hypothetical protein
VLIFDDAARRDVERSGLTGTMADLAVLLDDRRDVLRPGRDSYAVIVTGTSGLEPPVVLAILARRASDLPAEFAREVALMGKAAVRRCR